MGSASQGRVLLGRSVSVPCICLCVCVCVCVCVHARVCLISVPSSFFYVLVSACLPPSLHSLLSAKLPHLLCSSVITPGQECYLIISSLLAALSLQPLPFFLPADACLPWQP